MIQPRAVAGQLALALLLTQQARSADLMQAITELPSCGADCFMSVMQESACGLNMQCICTDQAFHEASQACIVKSCSVLDALEVARVEATACERTPRSRRNELFIPLAVEIPAWFCPWLRMYSRWSTSTGFALDDWLMLVCGVLYTVFVVIGQYTGLLAFGVDTWTIDPDLVTMGLKLFYIDESVYLVCLCLTKISVLCFYLRIFPNERFRYAAYIAMAFVIVPTIVFVLMQIFQCIPVRHVWEGWLSGKAALQCLDVNILAYSAASFSIAQDVVILILPLPLLFGLNTGKRSKAGIIFMFSLGIFVLVTSCVRLRYMIRFGNTSNPSWDFADPLIWSGLEVAVSIIVACLPAIRVLVIGVIPGWVASLSSGRRSSRDGYVKESSEASSGTGRIRVNGGRLSKQRRSIILFASKDREEVKSESQIELGLRLGDKVRGEVQTEICGPQQDLEDKDDGGITIKTTTTTRVDMHD